MKPCLLRVLVGFFTIAVGGAMHGNPIAQETSAQVPLPADLPELSRNDRAYWLVSQGTGNESTFTRLYHPNRDFLQSLGRYTPESIATVFGARMKQEQDVHMKLLLAAFAAQHGNAEARMFIEKQAESIDYAVTLSRCSALRQLVYAPHPGEWVFDAIHQALGDPRRVTGLEKTGWQTGTEFEIGNLADRMERLTYALGYVRNPKSVPVLLELAKRTDRREAAVEALGMIGDPRAIPMCLDLLAQADAALKKGTANSDPLRYLTRALAGLKARDAVPTLLAYLRSSEVVDALGEIGDERAIEPLQRIVAAQGKVDPDPDPHERLIQDRLFAARMALIKLELDDPVPRWIAVLEDGSLGWHERRKAVKELERHPDPRAIAPMLSLIRSAPDSAFIHWSIAGLSEYRYKATVSGLIECFDAPFPKYSGNMGSYEPGTLRHDIGEALGKLTGQSFGSDKARWAKWWDDTGKNLATLK